MRHKLLQFSTLLILLGCLSGIGYADTSPTYSFSFESGKRLIWDNESNSGLYFPAGFAFDQDFLPVGLSIRSKDLSIELIPQTFPDQRETFWNFTYYSTSRLKDTTALMNLTAKTTKCNGLQTYHVTYEREPLLHESTPYRWHSLFFIERGTYQGDLLIIHSNSLLTDEQALAYYKAGPALDAALVSTPSERVSLPIGSRSSNESSLFSSLDDKPTDNHPSPLWGIFEPSAPRSLSKVQTLERELDAEFPLILRYTSFADSFNQLKLDMATAKEEHRIVELTLQTNEDNRLDSSLYAVLNGTYDERLHQLAQLVREQEDPVLFRLNNEMNGDWCNYSALHYGLETRLYRDVWDWIYQVFQEEGATNAKWVFNPNERSFPQYRWNHMLAYLPEQDQIDAVGLTGYNTGNYYNGEIWRSFSEIYEPIYTEYTAVFDYPFLITEFASSSVGGDKDVWIRDMFKSLETFPKLEGLIWWNYADFDRNGKVARPYYIDETPEVLRAFKEGLQQFKSTQIH